MVKALLDIVRHQAFCRKYVFLIFVDIKGAYDHLWWSRVLAALHLRPISDVRLIRSILENSIVTTIARCNSYENTVKRVPTGIRAGPILVEPSCVFPS